MGAQEACLAIDAGAVAARGQWIASWRNHEPPGRLLAIARSASHCSFVVRRSGSDVSWESPIRPKDLRERWACTLPGPVLRHRTEMPEPREDQERVGTAVSPTGTVLDLERADPGSGFPPMGQLTLWRGGPGSYVLTRAPLTRRSAQLWEGVPSHLPVLLPALSPAVSEEWAAGLFPQAGGVLCRLVDLAALKTRAIFELEGATTASARLTDEHLTLTDDLGRLLVLDLRHGRLLRNTRIR
jgi:hypothetical protein